MVFLDKMGHQDLKEKEVTGDMLDILVKKYVLRELIFIIYFCII